MYEDFLNAVEQRLQTRDIALVRDIAVYLGISARDAFLLGLLAHFEGRYLMESSDVAGGGIGVGMRQVGFYDNV